MIRIEPYLNFNGNCAEAMKLYHQLLGGELQLKTHRDGPTAEHTPADQLDHVLHARLEVDGAVIMASDAPPQYYQKPGGNYVSLTLDDPAEIDRIYNALRDGATVQMEVQETFWSRRFGMLIDRFGTPWMFNCA